MLRRPLTRPLFAVFSLLMTITLALSVIPTAFAQENSQTTGTRPAPAGLAGLKLDTSLTNVDTTLARNKLDSRLAGAQGRQQVVVRLREQPVATVAEGLAQIDQAGKVSTQQDRALGVARSLDGRTVELGRTSKALNAVMLEIDAAALPALAADPNVVSVRPVVNYELALSETVPYIGAAAVQKSGVTGKGIRVAVLDSGVDYTHSKLGGPGTLTAYAAAYCGDPAAEVTGPECGPAHSQATNPAFFPNEKVIGGYDFVGEAWPRDGVPGGGPVNPDPNPIDFEGHGSHVADITAGLALPDPAKTRVRVAHASPDAPNVDVLVNGAVALANIPFKRVTEYASLPPGSYQVQVVPAGADSPVVISATLTLEAGTDYTVAATNRLADITPLVLTDDNSAPDEGKAKVRFVHASPNAPAVDIAVKGGPVLFSNIAFGKVGDYQSVAAGTYDLEVRPAGSTTVVLPLPGIELEAGKVYTAYAMGLVGGSSEQALTAVLSQDNAAEGSGVAPGAKIYGVKVCSAVSSSCSGIALLLGMDFAVDPNGDGNTNDRVDIINMSLGADYGIAYDDDLSTAVNNATALGVLTVASAGNGGNRPYVVGTPSAASTALSVAQTQVPSALQFALRIDAPASIAGLDTNTSEVAWAPITEGFSGDVVYIGRGCPAGSEAPVPPDGDPYLADPAGRIALIDRGACAVSTKVDRAAKAGARAVLVGLVAPGDPFAFGFGGGDTFVQTLVITQRSSNAIKGALQGGAAVQVTVSPDDAVELIGSVVGSSSRGPNGGLMFYSGGRIMFGQLIKPEIGAPGASVSAIAGSGSGTEAFGGTSGASPMVAGAAALLKEATGGRLAPAEMKSRLMNTAETEIFTRPTALGGELAPITRIGGGEVRIDRAIAAPAAAWEQNNLSGAISFGFVDASAATTRLDRTVVVRNYSDKAITYNINPTFRFEDDAASGAVSVSAPLSINVPARSSRTFRIGITIDGKKLTEWGLNSGPLGANGPALDTFEYDGYLELNDAFGNAANNLHLAWHVLPRLSGDVRGPDSVRLSRSLSGLPTGRVRLNNQGVGTARINAYSLIATSNRQLLSPAGSATTLIDLRALGVATFDGTAVCPANEFVMSFAVNTWYRQSHATFPGSFEINLDLNRDGTFDFQVFNFDLSLSPQVTDGRNAVFVANLATGQATVNFFTDHGLNSANTVLNLCSGQIGWNNTNLGQQMDVRIDAREINANRITDTISGIVLAPGGERYTTFVSDIPAGETQTVRIVDNGARGNPTETGVLLLLDGDRGATRGGAPEGNEVKIIAVRR